MLTLDGEGVIAVARTTSDRAAPKPCFTDPAKLIDAVKAGFCTHTEVRTVLGAALEPLAHPAFSEAITSCLRRSYCHIIVDESFDMNVLDARVIEHAMTLASP